MGKPPTLKEECFQMALLTFLVWLGAVAAALVFGVATL